jgi:hypothetical protein
MKDIYLYTNIGSWLDEKPDAEVKGIVRERTDHLIVIEDEEGFTQVINLDKLFCVVYQ